MKLQKIKKNGVRLKTVKVSLKCYREVQTALIKKNMHSINVRKTAAWRCNMKACLGSYTWQEFTSHRVLSYYTSLSRTVGMISWSVLFGSEDEVSLWENTLCCLRSVQWSKSEGLAMTESSLFTDVVSLTLECLQILTSDASSLAPALRSLPQTSRRSPTCCWTQQRIWAFYRK